MAVVEEDLAVTKRAIAPSGQFDRQVDEGERSAVNGVAQLALQHSAAARHDDTVSGCLKETAGVGQLTPPGMSRLAAHERTERTGATVDLGHLVGESLCCRNIVAIEGRPELARRGGPSPQRRPCRRVASTRGRSASSRGD